MTMTMTPEELFGTVVTGQDGSKLGKIDDVYLDSRTGLPEWAGVKAGRSGGQAWMIPLAAAQQTENGLEVPFDEDQLKDAPRHDPDTELSASDQDDLYRHYGLDSGGHQREDRAGQAGMQGHDASGPTTDEAMTRSEERLHVGTEQVTAGTARLRKYVVTENVTQTVPVSHEEVRLEREPITDANRGQAMSGGEITEEEHEITLHAERPVVSKETVPVERVRLGSETVTDEQTVTEQVRKEHIDDPAVETEGTDGDPAAKDKSKHRR